VRQEGDLLIVPVLEEVLVVEKRLRLTEEIVLRRVRREERHREPVVLRRGRAVVEREASAATDEGEPDRGAS
jgi:stress response protein YsnF